MYILKSQGHTLFSSHENTFTITLPVINCAAAAAAAGRTGGKLCLSWGLNIMLVKWLKEERICCVLKVTEKIICFLI